MSHEDGPAFPQHSDPHTHLDPVVPHAVDATGGADARMAEPALARRLRQLHLLAQSSQQLLLSANPEQEVAAICTEIASTIGMESFYHYRVSDTPGRLRLAVSGGIDELAAESLTAIGLGEPLCGEVAERRERVLIEDLRASTRPGCDTLRQAGVRAYAGFPLLAHGQLVGTLAFVSRRPTRLDESDIRVVQALCDQIAATLERTRLARELKASEERARLALDSGDLGSWDVDLVTGLVVWNRRHAELLGYAAHEAPASFERWQARVHPDDSLRVADAIEQARQDRQSMTIEHRVLRADTEDDRWLALYGRFSYDESGRAIRLSGVSRDVTDQKRAEQALRQSEQRYRRLHDSIRDAVVMVDLSGRIRESNLAFREMVGYSEGELATLTYVDLTPPQWHEAEARIVAEHILPTGTSPFYEKEYRRKDGRIIPVELRVSLLRDDAGEPQQMWAIVRDITARKQAEETLAVAHKRLEAALEASQVVLFSQDRELRYTWIHNPALGYASLDVVGKRDGDLFDRPADAIQTEAIKRRVLETATPIRQEVCVVQQGRPYHFDLVVQPDITPAGEIIGVKCAALDVTARRQAEESLRIAGHSFRQLVEQSPFGVYAVDADFRLVMVSAGARRVFENVPPPLIGRDFEEVLRIVWPEPFVSDALQHFRDTLATGVPYHAPRTIEQRADTSAKESYDWKIERMVLPDGRPGAVCHFYDLSERQRHEAALRASEHRYRTLLDATSAITWTSPPSGWHITEQPSWMAFTGQTAAEMLGFGWTDALHPDDRPAVTARWTEAVARDDVFESEHRLRRFDGAWRWVRATGAPVRDERGDTIEWFGAIVDINERRVAEEELRAADRQKDQFVAILAHELRNPLAPIRTAVALMNTRGLDDPVLARSRDVIDRHVVHMARLLDDLLDVSRLSRGTLVLQRALVPLSDVMTAAVEMVTPAIERRRQSLELAGPGFAVTLDADAARLVQVFGNLLTNASKFSPEQARIRVDAQVEDGTVSVRITDPGVGIAQADLASLFHLFSQVGRRDHTSAGGLGIGLALAKHLVDMHGGTLSAHSEGLDRGSVFSVSLPVSHFQPTGAATSASLPGRRLPRPLTKRVLVVDDNADAADMLARLIADLGGDVRTAYAGAAAYAEAAEFRPEVMLLDLGLPDLDGREVCRRIRAEAWGQQIRMVAVTGWGRVHDRQATRRAGFDDHLVKPADPEQLLRLLAGPTRERVQ